MIRAYVETTIFNRFYDERREYVAETRMFFDEIREGKIDTYTSTYVIDELEKAPSPKRERMLSLVSEYEIEVLESNDKAFDLADKYIELSIIPKKSRVDGVHIAMAAINNMDCIITLNFKHINKIKTKILTEGVHTMLDYSNPMICTPMEVLNYE
jgi:predicted nucleic acid-binding protein